MTDEELKSIADRVSEYRKFLKRISGIDRELCEASTDHTMIVNDIPNLLSEIARLKADNARLANENAALVAQIPVGFQFPKEMNGDCRMVD